MAVIPQHILDSKYNGKPDFVSFDGYGIKYNSSYVSHSGETFHLKLFKKGYEHPEFQHLVDDDIQLTYTGGDGIEYDLTNDFDPSYPTTDFLFDDDIQLTYTGDDGIDYNLITNHVPTSDDLRGYQPIDMTLTEEGAILTNDLTENTIEKKELRWTYIVNHQQDEISEGKSRFYIGDFLVEDPDQYIAVLVKQIKDSDSITIDFVGYVTPELYSEPYTDGIIEISMIATLGFNLLPDFTLFTIDNILWRTPIRNINKKRSKIEDIIKKTFSSSPYRISGVTEDTIDVSQFHSLFEDTYEMLSTILFDTGHWLKWINNYDSFGFSIEKRFIDNFKVYSTNETTIIDGGSLEFIPKTGTRFIYAKSFDAAIFDFSRHYVNDITTRERNIKPALFRENLLLTYPNPYYDIKDTEIRSGQIVNYGSFDLDLLNDIEALYVIYSDDKLSIEIDTDISFDPKIIDYLTSQQNIQSQDYIDALEELKHNTIFSNYYPLPEGESNRFGGFTQAYLDRITTSIKAYKTVDLSPAVTTIDINNLVTELYKTEPNRHISTKLYYYSGSLGLYKNYDSFFNFSVAPIYNGPSEIERNKQRVTSLHNIIDLQIQALKYQILRGSNEDSSISLSKNYISPTLEVTSDYTPAAYPFAIQNAKRILGRKYEIKQQEFKNEDPLALNPIAYKTKQEIQFVGESTRKQSKKYLHGEAQNIDIKLGNFELFGHHLELSSILEDSQASKDILIYTYSNYAKDFNGVKRFLIIWLDNNFYHVDAKITAAIKKTGTVNGIILKDTSSTIEQVLSNGKTYVIKEMILKDEYGIENTYEILFTSAVATNLLEGLNPRYYLSHQMKVNKLTIKFLPFGIDFTDKNFSMNDFIDTTGLNKNTDVQFKIINNFSQYLLYSEGRKFDIGYNDYANHWRAKTNADQYKLCQDIARQNASNRQKLTITVILGKDVDMPVIGEKYYFTTNEKKVFVLEKITIPTGSEKIKLQLIEYIS